MFGNRCLRLFVDIVPVEDVQRAAIQVLERFGAADPMLTLADVAEVVIDLLCSTPHALYNLVEMRPSQPPWKG